MIDAREGVAKEFGQHVFTRLFVRPKRWTDEQASGHIGSAVTAMVPYLPRDRPDALALTQGAGIRLKVEAKTSAWPTVREVLADPTGKGGLIGPGGVQWMTAASGILHEELHSQAFTSRGGTLEMAQLWVNLPARHKSAEPGYQTLLDRESPAVELPDGAGRLRVIRAYPALSEWRGIPRDSIF